MCCWVSSLLTAVFSVAAGNGMLYLNCLGENIYCIQMERLGILTPGELCGIEYIKSNP